MRRIAKRFFFPKYSFVLPIPNILIVSFLAVFIGCVAHTTRADGTFTFNDLSDSVPVSFTGSRGVVNVSCGASNAPEECNFDITPPAPGVTLVSAFGTTFADFTAHGTQPAAVYIGEPSTEIGDGGSTSLSLAKLSDRVTPVFLDSTHLFVDFLSDAEGPNGFNCSQAPSGSCNFFENGQIQTAGQVVWSDGSIDTVKFQSDVTPEPATMLLFGTGLLGIGFAIRRKHLA